MAKVRLRGTTVLAGAMLLTLTGCATSAKPAINSAPLTCFPGEPQLVVGSRTLSTAGLAVPPIVETTSGDNTASVQLPEEPSTVTVTSLSIEVLPPTAVSAVSNSTFGSAAAAAPSGLVSPVAPASGLANVVSGNPAATDMAGAQPLRQVTVSAPVPHHAYSFGVSATDASGRALASGLYPIEVAETFTVDGSCVGGAAGSHSGYTTQAEVGRLQVP